MTLQEAYNLLESLKNETTNKSKIRSFKKFLHILIKLKAREFSNDEIQSIEMELDGLNLESSLAGNKKQLNKSLKEFQEYLKENHSLISAGYYANIGVSMGALFGIVAGVVLDSFIERSMGPALGISIGMLIGVFVGRNMDAKAVTEGKVL